MQVTRKSILSGIVRTLELPITGEQYIKWQSGGLIQDVMPDLSEDDREFLMTGIIKEEWDENVPNT